MTVYSTHAITNRFLTDFKQVVTIDSASGFQEGILSVARFFHDRFTRLGLDSEILFPGNGQVPCLKAVTGPGPHDILLLGHMDTVFAKGEAAKRPFTIRDARAWGPGVCDMKGGLLVVLHALETLKQSGHLERLSLCVLFNGDEETGSVVSRPLIQDTAAHCRQALVFEPCRPGYRLVSQRKGGGWFHLTVTGKEAHAGADPHMGINAVVELAHLVSIIHGLNDDREGTSAQVTVIHGGDKINIIPATATASVDVRFLTPSGEKQIHHLFDTLSDRRWFAGSTVKVSGGIDRPPMAATPGSLAIQEVIISRAREMGIDMGTLTTGGCSDGNYTAAVGIPTVDGLGLVGANSHRADEYVELASIPVMVTLISRVCRHLSPPPDRLPPTAFPS